MDVGTGIVSYLGFANYRAERAPVVQNGERTVPQFEDKSITFLFFFGRFPFNPMAMGLVWP